MTKAELILAIGEAALAAGKDAPVTEGLTKPELEAVLVGLQPDAPEAKAPEHTEAMVAARRKAARDQADKEAAAAAPPPPARPAPYSVATGKAITSLRGIRADGDGVTEKDFPGGKDTLDRLVKSGHVVKS